MKDELRRVVKAAIAVNKMYPWHWDRVDGGAVVMPDRVEEFEKRFGELNEALEALDQSEKK